MTRARPEQEPAGASLEFLSALRGAANILILTHHHPDGDALGSAAAFCRALTGRGRRAALHISGRYAENLAFLLPPEIRRSDLSDLDEYDLWLLLDCHGLDRLGEASQALLAAAGRRPPLLVLDHHLLDEGRTPGPLWHHRAGASSAGELAWEVFKALGLEPDGETANALLTAIITDTGSFTQSNATPLSLRAAAELAEKGGDLALVNHRLHQNRPARRLRLLALVLATLETHFDGRLALIFITNEMLAQSGAVMIDGEGFVEMLRDLAGVTLAAVIRDADNGRVKVSLRSRDAVDASALAARFTGGGHRQAAAYTDPLARNVLEARARLLAAAPDFLQVT